VIADRTAALWRSIAALPIQTILFYLRVLTTRSSYAWPMRAIARASFLVFVRKIAGPSGVGFESEFTRA